jgi:hypothetical protein
MPTLTTVRIRLRDEYNLSTRARSPSELAAFVELAVRRLLPDLDNGISLDSCVVQRERRPARKEE